MLSFKWTLFAFSVFTVIAATAVRAAEADPNANAASGAKIAPKGAYLAGVSAEMKKTWPHNRIVNIVAHGHSVPAGYFVTPRVETFNSYPHLLHAALKERFPNAVINVIVTAKGGEQSEQGAARFERDVLGHNPDVLLIDYGLNDRALPLDRAEKAWSSMIEKAKAKNIEVLLLTPTGDARVDINNDGDDLNQRANQIRGLAVRHEVGLVDSYAAFKAYVNEGEGHKLADLMSMYVHPNRKGHEIVTTKLLEWFPQ